MSALSAWCWTPPGFTHTAAQHRACQMRQDEADERKRIGACGCGEFGGHEKPVVERETASRSDRMGAKKTAPGGALTPGPRGLADCKGVD